MHWPTQWKAKAEEHLPRSQWLRICCRSWWPKSLSLALSWKNGNIYIEGYFQDHRQLWIAFKSKCCRCQTIYKKVTLIRDFTDRYISTNRDYSSTNVSEMILSWIDSSKRQPDYSNGRQFKIVTNYYREWMLPRASIHLQVSQVSTPRGIYGGISSH